MADKVSMSLDDIIKSDPKLKRLRRGRGGKLGFSNRGVTSNAKSGSKRGVSIRGRGGVTRGRGGVVRGRGGVTRGRGGAIRGRGGRGLTLAKQSVAKARAQLKVKEAKALLKEAVAEVRSVSRQQTFNKGRALENTSAESPRVQITYSSSSFSRGRGRGQQKRGQSFNVKNRYSAVQFSRQGRGRGQYYNKMTANTVNYVVRNNAVSQQRSLQSEYLNQARALIKAKKEASIKPRGRGYAHVQTHYENKINNYQASFHNRNRRGGRGNRGGRGRMVYL